MGNVQLIGSFIFLWLCLPSPGHCQVNVQSVEVFPQQSVTNGTVTLTCRATSFDPDVYMFTWQHSVGSSYSEVMADDRISLGPANLVDERVKLYSQILTITNLTTSDAGSYLCVIKDNRSIIANGEGRLTVNSTEEFPVCFPDGLAVVNEGDILTCRTVIDDRTPVVSDTSSPIERSDWVKTPLAVNESGSRLQKSVKVSDDGVMFFCFSIIPENQNLTSLSCKIGNLTVIPDPLTTPMQPQTLPTEEPALPLAAIIGIAVGSFLLLLLLLLLLLIRTKCCRCKPKSYLLNFGGFFGSTIQRRQPTDRNQTDVEFSRQNPDGSDEPDPAHDGRVRISFDGEDDPDVLPIVKTEPNIYEERKGPGTSFQRETDPEEDAYWNENLKQQLAEAVDDEDDLSD